MFAKAFVLVSLAVSALGNVYITSPTGSTTFTGGQQATINWQDDGTAPNLQQFGLAKISIYVGNAITQTPLQLISDNVDVSKTSNLQFVPNPSIGPNSNDYFIRVESLNLKDPKNPQYPALAFSSKFTLSGMSGQFNASIQSEIAGQSTAPIGGSTAAAAGASSASATSSKATTTSATHSSASAKSTHNAAVNLKAGSFGLVMVGIVGAAVF
ncbi:hypothetical protein AX17_007030 [Amanita inopinata Kibby_2008]|nr:hypothetical protein AX17_007030 [Amanita inopinata Kibby_2008]